MTPIFQLAAHDQSQFYLAYLFGTVGNVLSPTKDAVTLNVVGVMFKVLNMIALTVGVLIVIYTTVMGVIATAHEGEALGKRWSGLWVPFRMVLGVLMLFPVKTGYSFLQIIMMWIILQGVGAADKLWTTVLNYISLAGSPYATVTIPTVGVKDDMKKLFQDIVCQSTAGLNTTSKLTNPATGKSLYYCEDHLGDSACNIQAALPANTNIYNMGPTVNGAPACGHLDYCTPGDASTLAGVTCQAQQQALAQIISTFGMIGDTLAKSDQAYISFYISGEAPSGGGSGAYIELYCNAQSPPISPCCFKTSQQITEFNRAEAQYNAGLTPNPPAPLTCSTNFPKYYAGTSTADYTNAGDDFTKNMLWPFSVQPLVTTDPNVKSSADFINSAVNIYINAIVQAVTNFYANQNTGALSGWQANASDLGWILAGGYYYQMATMGGGDKKNQFTLPTFVATANDPSGQSGGNDLKNYRNNFSAANVLLTKIQGTGQAPSAMSSSTAPGMASISGYSSGVSEGILSAFMSMIGTQGDDVLHSSPLAKLVAFGHGMMITGDVVFAVFLAVTVVLLVSLGWSPVVVGTGVIAQPLGNLALGYTMIFIPIVMAILGFVYAVGGLLAVYTPLIPYMIYTLGAIGWMIAVIEAMAAAPFVALGILMPGEQSGVFGKAEGALMALLNIFLRPTLMVFGMMASMLLSSAAVALVNAAFKNVVAQISPTYGSFVEPFIFIAAYVALILSVLNKAFSLIHIIPDKVLQWIGGQYAPGGGETGQEAMQEAKGKTGAAAAAAGGAAAGAAGKTGGKFEKAGEKKQAKDERREEAALERAEGRKEAAEEETKKGGAVSVKPTTKPPGT